jgi:hypothetical protein
MNTTTTTVLSPVSPIHKGYETPSALDEMKGFSRQDINWLENAKVPTLTVSKTDKRSKKHEKRK